MRYLLILNKKPQAESLRQVGEKINIGKVGPWPLKAPEYMGGADQVILKFNYPESAWVQSIKDFKTGKIYMYGEFVKAFPNLCR